MTETLKACPFCGGKPYVRSMGEVACPRAGCVIGGVWMSPAAWNRRAEPPSPSGTPSVCRESGTPECAPGGGGEPTPEALEAWAEWFDDPNKSPSMNVEVFNRYSVEVVVRTPGYLLRAIARRLRAAREE